MQKSLKFRPDPFYEKKILDEVKALVRGIFKEFTSLKRRY
jgi:hypothetical protein